MVENVALDALADHLNDLVALFDEDRHCQFLNRTGRRLLRIGPDGDVSSYRLAQIPAANDRERFATILGTVDGGTAWSGALAVASTVTGEFPTRSTLTPIAVGGRSWIAWVARDTSTDRDVIKSLRERAFYDSVTGLSHRSLFLDRLDLLLRRSGPDVESVGVLFVSPDRFKEMINRFEVGSKDLLLKSIAQRITDVLGAGESVHRWGEEEFVVLAEHVADEQSAERVAERVADAFAEPFSLAATEVYLAVSVGIAIGRPGEMTTDELIRHADSAGHAARSQGSGARRLFDGDLRARAERRAELEAALRGAAGRGELVLHFQPEVSLRTNQIVACEALVRWEHPSWGLVLPGEFIPVAEASKLIIELGDWVLREALTHSVEWARRYTNRNPISVAVNISGRQFAADDFEEKVARAIDETGADPTRICLEITESVLLDDAEETVAKLRRLKSLGVHLAIDDFGTGYSSLSYLRRFPVDILKVDQSFVAGLGHDPGDSAIVQAVIHMGQALHMTTLAEGVETAHHVIELRELSCDIAQGFHFARPVTAEQFVALLDAGDDWMSKNAG